MRDNGLIFLLVVVLLLACGNAKKKQDEHTHVEGKFKRSDYFKKNPELPKAKLLDLEKLKDLDPKHAEKFEHIHPLDEVTWTPSSEIKNIKFDDEVTIFTIKDKHYVLPWYVMKNHHVGNFSVDGVDVVVTLCEACSGSSAFSPWLDGKKLHFQLGGTYNGTNCMMDDDGEVWGTFTGKALTGPNKGKELERIQMYQGLWVDWLKSGFGEIYAADYSDELRKGHGSGFHIGDPRVNFQSTMEQPIDKRMIAETMVQGVYLNGAERAYTHNLIKSQGVVQDTLGGESIVLFSIPGTTIISCFNRRVDEQILSFSTSDDQKFFVDDQTKSFWRFDGTCVSGSLQGTKLNYVPNYHEEWYAWSGYRPNTTIYNE